MAQNVEGKSVCNLQFMLFDVFLLFCLVFVLFKYFLFEHIPLIKTFSFF